MMIGRDIQCRIFITDECILSKEVGVRSCLRQEERQYIVFDSIYQYPIGTNMAIPKPFAIPMRRMVTVFLRQCLPGCKYFDGVVKHSSL
jgi:hypothetical protein